MLVPKKSGVEESVKVAYPLSYRAKVSTLLRKMKAFVNFPKIPKKQTVSVYPTGELQYLYSYETGLGSY